MPRDFQGTGGNDLPQEDCPSFVRPANLEQRSNISNVDLRGDIIIATPPAEYVTGS